MKNFSYLYRGSSKPSFWNFLKMVLTSKNRAQVSDLKNKIPFEKCDLQTLHHPTDRPQVTWIGHSSLLIQNKGLNILLDPLFSKKASPLTWLGPTRYTPLPLSLEELPRIDLILISHNHFDHLDKKVVLYFKSKVEWIVPKGLGSWFQKMGLSGAIELNWWESVTFFPLIVTATPSQHWSKRSLFDQFKSLWCSYVLDFQDFKFYFAGDTGFNQNYFEEIKNRFSPFDLSAIPIGAYDPEWFMHPFHINPEEALKIHQILQSKKSIPIHWGTFAITFEPITEPPERLIQAGASADFEPIPIGRTLIL